MIWQIIRHPLRALGILLFLAALEGMFGSPSGAGRIATIVIVIVLAAIVFGLVMLAVAITAFGYGVHLWVAIGIAALLWIAYQYGKSK